MPELRAGPPYAMTEMIAAEPALAERILRRLASAGTPERLATMIRWAAAADGALAVTGCGTSEHAAQAIAEILGDALRRSDPSTRTRPIAVQAFELAQDPGAGGLGPGTLCIGVSHEGGTAATNEALRAAAAAEAATALVTVGSASPGATLADLVLATGEQDQSWCHTVGYLSPVVAGAAVGAALMGGAFPAAAVRGLLAASSSPARAAEAEALAAALADVDRLIVLASGADRPAARELALKVEEGVHLAATMRDLETFLHGHLAAIGPRTGVVLVLADRARLGPGLRRAAQALAAARAVGAPSGAIVSASAALALDPAATPAGRIVVPDAPALPAPAAALLTTAPALQLLTERLARARGTNPDPIGRDDPRYRDAAGAAE